MSARQASPVTPTRKGDGQPTKHILLQKENLVTHDRTWLPARVAPPKLTETKPYGVYLVEYEQYLAALQYMKGRFLQSRRWDKTQRLNYVPTLLPPTRYEEAGGTKVVERTARPLVFGTIDATALQVSSIVDSKTVGYGGQASIPVSNLVPVAGTATYTLRTPLKEEPQAPPSPIILTTSEPPAKNSPTEKQIADRKAAKKARRKARVAARKVEKATAAVAAETEKVLAVAALVTARTKLSAEKQKAKRRSPAAVERRRAKREAARLKKSESGRPTA